MSAHKLYGPKGAGALYVRQGTPLAAIQTGGHQERGLRGGTENVAAIVGFGAAIRLAADNARLASLRDEMERRLLAAIPDVAIAGFASERVANTSCVCIRGAETEALLMALDLEGICASGGSACTAGSLEPSHVLQAMGVDAAWARGAIRLSLGRENTAADVDAVVAALGGMVARYREVAGRAKGE